jgi:hypothetical protein
MNKSWHIEAKRNALTKTFENQRKAKKAWGNARFGAAVNHNHIKILTTES